jgi:dihydrofolate reductase
VVNASAADVITELKATGEGDILVNSSPSVIKALLEADLIDRLYLIICPEIAGGGGRLFEDGLPGTKWTVSHQETGELGETAVVYDRVR